MISILAVTRALAQPVLVEEFVEAGGLVCFPVYGDTTIFKYLPARGRLAMAGNDLPEFSFLRYALGKDGAAPSSSSISEAHGGGLLHFFGFIRYT